MVTSIEYVYTQKTKAAPGPYAITIIAVFAPKCWAGYYEFVNAYASRTVFAVASLLYVLYVK